MTSNSRDTAQAEEIRLRQFFEWTSEAQKTMTFMNGTDGFEIAKKAFNLYGVVGTDDWRTRLDKSYLKAVQKEQIRETAYISLVLLADWGVRWGWPNPKDPKIIQRSMDLLQRALANHEPTRAFYYVRSLIHREQGDILAEEKDLESFV